MHFLEHTSRTKSVMVEQPVPKLTWVGFNAENKSVVQEKGQLNPASAVAGFRTSSMEEPTTLTVAPAVDFVQEWGTDEAQQKRGARTTVSHSPAVSTVSCKTDHTGKKEVFNVFLTRVSA